MKAGLFGLRRIYVRAIRSLATFLLTPDTIDTKNTTAANNSGDSIGMGRAAARGGGGVQNGRMLSIHTQAAYLSMMGDVD